MKLLQVAVVAASAVLFGCAAAPKQPYNSGNVYINPAPAVIGQINLPK